MSSFHLKRYYVFQKGPRVYFTGWGGHFGVIWCCILRIYLLSEQRFHFTALKPDYCFHITGYQCFDWVSSSVSFSVVLSFLTGLVQGTVKWERCAFKAAIWNEIERAYHRFQQWTVFAEQSFTFFFYILAAFMPSNINQY